MPKKHAFSVDLAQNLRRRRPESVANLCDFAAVRTQKLAQSFGNARHAKRAMSAPLFAESASRLAPRKHAIGIEIAQNFARKRADVLQILCNFGAQRIQHSAGVRRKNCKMSLLSVTDAG